MKDNIIIRPHRGEDGKTRYGVYFVYDTIGKGDTAPALCYMPTLYLAGSLVRYLNGGEMSKDEKEEISVAFRKALRRKNVQGSDEQKPTHEKAKK